MSWRPSLRDVHDCLVGTLLGTIRTRLPGRQFSIGMRLACAKFTVLRPFRRGTPAIWAQGRMSTMDGFRSLLARPMMRL